MVLTKLLALASNAGFALAWPLTPGKGEYPGQRELADVGTDGGGRTHTSFRILDFKSNKICCK